jgi:hypothetical protein
MIPTGGGTAIVVSEIDSWIDKPNAELCVTKDITLRRWRAPLPSAWEPDAARFCTRADCLSDSKIDVSAAAQDDLFIPDQGRPGHQFLFFDDLFHDTGFSSGWQVTRRSQV